VLDLLAQLLSADRAADVVVLAEHVMARLDTAVNRVDDSCGYLGSVVARLQDLHHAACLAARPDPRRWRASRRIRAEDGVGVGRQPATNGRARAQLRRRASCVVHRGGVSGFQIGRLLPRVETRSHD